MKIGVIGSGNIGSTVGTLWVKAGHPALFSSRHPEQLKPLVNGLGSLARAGTVQEALKFGDVIFLGVPYAAYPQIGKDHARELAGKIVLDAGNAVPSRDGEIAKEARENGIGITSAKYLAGARVQHAKFSQGRESLESSGGTDRHSDSKRRSGSAEGGVDSSSRRRFRSGDHRLTRTRQAIRARRAVVRTRNYRPRDAAASEDAPVRLGLYAACRYF
ncbi:MAG: NADPH-dependent F420 reductase [Candidatus Binatia bacterium]